MSKANEKIFVIVGIIGDYSDRSEWEVCAYRDKALAERHLELLNTWREERDRKRENYMKRNPDVEDWELDVKCSLDPKAHIYYGDVPDYSIVELPVFQEVPDCKFTLKRWPDVTSAETTTD